MTLIIKISLLLNQYHGNAWHHAHCEGLIDWPPAPWRILRAVVAGFYNTYSFPKVQQDILKQVLWKMAQVDPLYYLPPTAYLQWRSPRPQVKKDATIGPGKVLYAACLLLPEDDSAIYCQYPIDCSEEELTIFQQALNSITYLGRRESPALWELVEEMAKPANAYPDPNGLKVVASPMASLTVDELWEALNLSAADVFQNRKQAVFPGVEQITYKLKPTLFQPPRDRPPSLPQRVLLSVKGGFNVSVSQAINLCEAIHQKLVKFYSDPTSTGMEMEVKSDFYNHAFITPIPDRTHRWIEYLELYSQLGFPPSAINGIAQISKINLNQEIELEVVDFSHSSLKYSCWQSVTPMFLDHSLARHDREPRYLPGTSYQQDCPEHQVFKSLRCLPHLPLDGKPVFEELAQGLAMKINGELIAVCQCDRWLGAGKMLPDKHHKFVLNQGFKVWLEFRNPVSAPISLGYGCHRGLGALSPASSWASLDQLIPQQTVSADDLS